MRKIIIGVMGPGEGATVAEKENAYQLGKSIALAGWVLLTGGRKAGVMDTASRGAKSVGGLTVGILPDSNHIGMSEAIDLAIVTDLGNARNNINVLSSDVVVACGMGLGTTSEVALALKNEKPVILLNSSPESQAFFIKLSRNKVAIANSPEQAIEFIHNYLVLR
jgi:uncharacterized protein (TIGR00725 family)